MKFKQIAITSFMIYQTACCNEISNIHSAVMKRLGIGENFRGFSYIVGDDVNRLTIRLLPGAFADKKLNGIVLTIDKNGEMKSIEPSFETNDESFDPIAWAFDVFKEKKIGIDSLWEICKSSLPKTDNKNLLVFLVSTLERSEGYPKLNMIGIPTSGPLTKAIDIEFSDKTEKIHNLLELKKALGPY